MQMENYQFKKWNSYIWVRQGVESVNIREKQYHACDNSEIEMKTKTMLGQTNIHEKYQKFSLKSRK